jgi:hypothetical protein
MIERFRVLSVASYGCLIAGLCGVALAQPEVMGNFTGIRVAIAGGQRERVPVSGGEARLTLPTTSYTTEVGMP